MHSLSLAAVDYFKNAQAPQRAKGSDAALDATDYPVIVDRAKLAARRRNQIWKIMFTISNASRSNVIAFARPLVTRIECGDNLKFMRSLPAESMHMIVTSPPYNIGKTYEKRTPLEAYKESQTAAIAEAVRLLHPKGSICWQVGNHVDDGEVFPLDIMLYDLFKNHGLKLRVRPESSCWIAKLSQHQAD